jgi:hypothetical protein
MANRVRSRAETDVRRAHRRRDWRRGGGSVGITIRGRGPVGPNASRRLLWAVRSV